MVFSIDLNNALRLMVFIADFITHVGISLKLIYLLRCWIIPLDLLCLGAFRVLY